MDISPIPIPPHKIGLLLVDGFALMSYSSCVEPLRAANLLAGRTLYDIHHLAVGKAVAASSSGARIECLPITRVTKAFDLVLVIAGGDPMAFDDTVALQWLRTCARRATSLGGVSGGPVILARAGLMAGRRMTVHWEHASPLGERDPGLLLERSLYVIDRDRLTCAGGIAPLDMMHALITAHHGPGFARKVSDWFMHTEVRPSAGPQRAGLVERHGTTDPAILIAIEAMGNRIADPLNLSRLAAMCGLGSRQLNRLFRDKLGQSTMTFYRALRLETAGKLLEQTPLTLTEIALATGFSSSAHFSKAFSQAFGQPPSRMRA